MSEKSEVKILFNFKQKLVYFALIMEHNILINIWIFFLKEEGIQYQSTCCGTP